MRLVLPCVACLSCVACPCDHTPYSCDFSPPSENKLADALNRGGYCRRLQSASYISSILLDSTTSRAVTLLPFFFFFAHRHIFVERCGMNSYVDQETDSGKLVLCFFHDFKLVPSGMMSGNCIWQVISLIFIFNTKYKLPRVEIDSICSSGRPQACGPLIPIPDSCHDRDALQYPALMCIMPF